MTLIINYVENDYSYSGHVNHKLVILHVIISALRNC